MRASEGAGGSNRSKRPKNGNAGRLAALLRVFLPSWNFFSTPGPEFRLSYGLLKGQGLEPDAWRDAWPQAPERGWISLFWNPRGNLALAARSLIEQAYQELQALDVADSAQLEKEPAYGLLRDLVRYEIRNREPRLAGAERFRFRLELREAEGFETILLSAEHRVR